MKPIEEPNDIKYVDNDEDVTIHFIEEPNYNPIEAVKGSKNKSVVIIKE